MGLNEAIRDRVESMRVNSGIEPDVDLRLPDDLPDAVEAIVFKNVAEALTNVEKHSHATRIRAAAAALDGGAEAAVTVDGTGFVVDAFLYRPSHLRHLAR